MIARARAGVRVAAVLVAAVVAPAAIGCGAPSSSQRAMPDPLDSVSGEELFARGMMLAESEDYVRAEQYLAASIERGIPEARVIQPLVSSCVRSSRLSAALRYAEPYLGRNPDAWSLRLLVATIHMGLGDAPAARRHLERVTEEQPEESVPHYMLAVLARDALQDPQTAEAHFRRYLEIAPEGEHASEARAALAHPMDRETIAVGAAEAPESAPAAMPVRMPSHATEDAETQEAAP